jgi:hypothetical protein
MAGESSAAGQCETPPFAAVFSLGELQAPPTLDGKIKLELKLEFRAILGTLH